MMKAEGIIAASRGTVRARKPSIAGPESPHGQADSHDLEFHTTKEKDSPQSSPVKSTRSNCDGADSRIISAKRGKSKVTSCKKRTSPIAYLLCFARLLCFFVMSVCIIIFGLFFYPFLTLLKPFYWRRFSDQLEAVWVNGCLRLFPSTYLVQQGEFPDSSTRPKVIICNHTTDIDWYYLWMTARTCKIDRTGNVKIMLKREVRTMPVIGWGCRLFQFIFLKRDWKEDEKVIETSLKRFCEDGEPLWIFLFPEGMTINTRSIEKSKAFARASPRPRPELELTLLPRGRGFQSVLELIAKYSRDPPEVFDMTMCFDSYTGEIPSWEMGYSRNRDLLIPNHSSLVFGSCSSRCHIDSRKFTMDEVVAHPDGIEGWLDERWTRKERLLEKFIQKQGFDVTECGPAKVTLVEGSLWKSVIIVAANAAMWIYLAIAIQHKTESVSFWEMLPQYV